MLVTATYARQNFAELLERAIAGEEIAIGRHGRLVARIVPAHRDRAPLALRSAGAVAAARGVPPDSAISRLFSERAARRLQVAKPRAQAAVRKLLEHGVKARIVGSLARGVFRQYSDVDLLIENRGKLDEATIEEVVREQMRDFPFDLLYADRLPEGVKRHVAGVASR